MASRVANAVPANDFNGLVQYAKAHPGEISYATLGAGSAQEILARQIEKLAGIQMNRIPFRTGPQVMPDLIAGPCLDLRVADHRRAAATCRQAAQDPGDHSPERLKGMADVPTLKEKGIDYVRYGFLGICAAKGTPQPILDLLNRHIVSIVATPDYRDLIEKGGSLPESSTPQDWGKSSHRRWTTLRLQSANSACSRNNRHSEPDPNGTGRNSDDDQASME